MHSLVLDARNFAKLSGSIGQVSKLASLATGTNGSLELAAALVSTSGNQIYNMPLTYTVGTATSPVTFRSMTGDIDFASTISAGANAKPATRSLFVEALNGNVYLRDQVGISQEDARFSDYLNLTDVNPYNFQISAADIWLYADVTSFEQQIYNGTVHIGNNGANGFTRLLISLDPTIHFSGPINDAVERTHTLDVRAVTTNVANGLIPTIRFDGTIGQDSILYGLRALTGVQAEDPAAMIGTVLSDLPGARFGTVTIGGNINTWSDQTYVSGSILIGSNSGTPVSLYSAVGVVRLLARPDPNEEIIDGGNLARSTSAAALALETVTLGMARETHLGETAVRAAGQMLTNSKSESGPLKTADCAAPAGECVAVP